MEPFIRDLIEISIYAGQHPRLVQGGGGNCSVKAGRTMAVKASGFFLEELTGEAGYSLIDLDTGSVSGPSPKPSLETPLHTLLGTFVIHTHPMALGAFVCSREGTAELARLFPERQSVFVPYADPGKALYEAMKRIMAGKNLSAADPLILFLENHGIFVSAPEKDACRTLHEEAVRRLEDFLGIQDYETYKGTPLSCRALDYLTPDHAVYLNLGPAESLSKKQRIAVSELQTFTSGVMQMIRKRHWSPKFLSAETAARLLNMEEEKYRQKMLREGNR